MTPDELKSIAQKRRLSIELKSKEVDRTKQADYSFIDAKSAQDSGLLSERRNTLLLQESQIKRLDKVDKLEGEGEAPGSFLGLPSITFFFDQFAGEMLTKASKARNLLDLQQELQKNSSSSEANNGDVDMKEHAILDFSEIGQELQNIF